MTTAADDSAVEDAFEALLAGRPVPEGAAGLAAFTQAVRTSATPPGRPNAALAELLATGLLTDQSSPSARTAGTAGSPPVRPSRVRIRRRAAMIFPVLIAKFLSAGAVAQAATGASVVVVAFTGIGAVGALPAPVQDTFATVVETVTPLEAPTSGDDTADTVTDETVVDDVVTEPTDEATESTEDEAETAEFDLDAWIEAGPEGYDSFGAWVTESAHNPDLKSALRARGQNFGSMVSKWAHDKGLDEDDLAAEGVDLDELIDGSTEPDSVVDADVTEVEQTEVAATTEDRGSRVSGNGKSSNGNSKSVSGSG
ncbi:MAG: hypothetical protein ABWY33_01700, partial [Cellulomonas sp.]